MQPVATVRRALLGMSLATLLTVAGQPSTDVRAHADDPPVLHHVKYTLTAASPSYADIYYLDQEPPVFSEYSHNPYEFVPNVQADVGPRAAWNYELDLENPYQWAFFTANAGHQHGTPMFHCQLMVDGAIVAMQDGPRGVLCSMRPW